MTKSINEIWPFSNLLRSYQAQVVLCCCAAIYGMLWSAEAIISISMILLVLIALFQIDFPTAENTKTKFGFRKNIRAQLQGKMIWWWITVPFLLVLFSVPYSEDWTYTLERLRIKLPFLILPFAFAVMPTLGRKELRIIGTFFIAACTIAAIGVLWNYIQNFEAINYNISRGKAIPTPSNHIRFSLSMACGIFVAMAFTLEEKIFGIKGEKYLFGILTVFLFIFLHILSVRSGLLAFYVALGVFLMQFIYRSRRWKIGLAGIIAMIAIPYFAVIYVPSFKNKYYYMKHDVHSYFEGKGKDYSDGGRLISLNAAKEIILQHPIIGVGAGDLKKEMYQVYANKSAEDAAEKMPHSQFITVLAGTGFIGLTLFLISFFIPLFYQKKYRNYLFTALHVIFFISFFSENTFENNFGLSLWLFMLLLGMNYQENSRS
jgi:O-antigen ligase